MGASDRGVAMRASINAMTMTGPANVTPKPAPTTKAASKNVFDMSRQCQLQAHLGRNLQAVYQDVVKEPVPERFIKLLDGLKRN
jgi:hypothetical protein